MWCLWISELNKIYSPLKSLRERKYFCHAYKFFELLSINIITDIPLMTCNHINWNLFPSSTTDWCWHVFFSLFISYSSCDLVTHTHNQRKYSAWFKIGRRRKREIKCALFQISPFPIYTKLNGYNFVVYLIFSWIWIAFNQFTWTLHVPNNNLIRFFLFGSRFFVCT